jgi:2-hydroxychromene-2-carboxylate isomerase
MGVVVRGAAVETGGVAPTRLPVVVAATSAEMPSCAKAVAAAVAVQAVVDPARQAVVSVAVAVAVAVAVETAAAARAVAAVEHCRARMQSFAKSLIQESFSWPQNVPFRSSSPTP